MNCKQITPKVESGGHLNPTYFHGAVIMLKEKTDHLTTHILQGKMIFSAYIH